MTHSSRRKRKGGKTQKRRKGRGLPASSLLTAKVTKSPDQFGGCGCSNSVLSNMIKNVGGKRRKTVKISGQGAFSHQQLTSKVTVSPKKFGGTVEFTPAGMPSNLIPLNGQQDSPQYLMLSGRLTSGGKKRKPLKKGGIGFSDWSTTTNNPIVQFNSVSDLSTKILSGASYADTPYNSMDFKIKPMV